MSLAAAPSSSPPGRSIQALASGSAPRIVYTDPWPGELADVGRDGRLALHRRIVTPSESRLLLLDLETGSARRLYPAEGRVVVDDGAKLSPDGRLAYVATDEGAEAAVLLVLDVATGREVARYVESDPATARIRETAVTTRGERT